MDAGWERLRRPGPLLVLIERQLDAIASLA